MTTRYDRDPAVDKSLQHSIRDGAAYSVMAGSGETYFSAFALFLKANTAQIGFLASVPPLLASFAQLLSAWLGHRTGKRKAIILAGATLQGLMWLPIALLPLLKPDHAVEWFILFVILYYGFGNIAALQWSSLMGDLVAERKRGRYFAQRTRISSMTSFLALVSAGLLLHLSDYNQYTLIGFVIIFSIAFLARLVSIYHIAHMLDRPGQVAAMELPVNMQWWRRLRHSPVSRFFLLAGCIQFSVSFGSPFFSLYLLRDLHFSYFEFMSCTAASVLIQFFTLQRWGILADALGNRAIMVFCGMAIPLVPLSWLLSTDFWYLLLVQALGGFIWAGFSLSSGNYLYELIPAEKRATYLAIHNVISSCGVFSGAMLGGLLGSACSRDFSLAGMDFHLTSELYVVFLGSFVLRFFFTWLFLPRIKERRKLKTISVSRVIFRVARFNPLTGLFFDAIGSRRMRKTRPEE